MVSSLYQLSETSNHSFFIELSKKKKNLGSYDPRLIQCTTYLLVFYLKDQNPYSVLFSSLNALNSFGVLTNMPRTPVNSLSQTDLSFEL